MYRFVWNSVSSHGHWWLSEHWDLRFRAEILPGNPTFCHIACRWIVKMSVFHNLIHRFNAVSMKTGYSVDINTLTLKFMWRGCKIPRTGVTTVKEKNRVTGPTLPDFRTYCRRSCGDQGVWSWWKIYLSADPWNQQNGEPRKRLRTPNWSLTNCQRQHSGRKRQHVLKKRCLNNWTSTQWTTDRNVKCETRTLPEHNTGNLDDFGHGDDFCDATPNTQSM